MILELRLAELKEKGINGAYEEFREGYFKRMWNVSLFMKVLKQRFTQWYNKQHQRTGTLWESRFSSSIIQAGGALKEVAAYIDLNPVRAKICDDPKGYRLSGYAEALGGGELAREAIRYMTSLDSRVRDRLVKIIVRTESSLGRDERMELERCED